MTDTPDSDTDESTLEWVADTTVSGCPQHKSTGIPGYTLVVLRPDLFPGPWWLWAVEVNGSGIYARGRMPDIDQAKLRAEEVCRKREVDLAQVLAEAARDDAKAALNHTQLTVREVIFKLGNMPPDALVQAAGSEWPMDVCDVWMNEDGIVELTH